MLFFQSYSYQVIIIFLAFMHDMLRIFKANLAVHVLAVRTQSLQNQKDITHYSLWADSYMINKLRV